MIEVFVDAKALEGAQDFLREFDRILEEELREAFRSRIGPRCSATARKILSEDVYSVEIPFRRTLLSRGHREHRAGGMWGAYLQDNPGIARALRRGPQALNTDLLEKARRQVRAGKNASPAEVLQKVREKFGGSSSGQPFRRWKRTGDLLGKEMWRALDGGEIGVALVNASGHARPRNALGGKPGPPDYNQAGRRSGQQSGLSPTKEVHWQREAAKREQPFIAQELRRAFGRAWRRKP